MKKEKVLKKESKRNSKIVCCAQRNMKFKRTGKILLMALAIMMCSLKAGRAQTGSGNDRCEIAKKLAKDLFIAMGDANFEKIKKIVTSDFYNTEFSARNREILLNTPYEKKQRMVRRFTKEAEITTLPNKGGDVVTVFFENTTTGKEFTIRFVNEGYESADWRVWTYCNGGLFDTNEKTKFLFYALQW